MHGVGVGKEEPCATGLLRSGPAGVGLAGKAAVAAEVKGRGSEDDYALVSCGGGFGDLASAVAGVVVDDYEFPLDAEEESGLGLGEQGLEAHAEGSGFVARGDDDGEAHLSGGGGGAIGLGYYILRIVHSFVL